MITVEKPPLDEELLVHFGIKGMKWGQKKAKSSSGSSSKKAGMSTGKKVAIGTAAVAGAAAVAYLMTRRGNIPHTRIGKVNLKPSVMDKLREANQMKVSNFNQIKPTLGKTQYFDAAKGTWAAPSSGALVRRSPGKTTHVNMGDLNDVRRAWSDPNHVWQL